MNRQKSRVFINTNILIFAMQYRKENVFEWIDLLYHDVWIHADVMAELLQGKSIIEQELAKRHWQVFDSTKLTNDEIIIYKNYISEIKNAFREMNHNRALNSERVKHTADTGEIATLAPCLLEDVPLICSDDGDIRTVILQERYAYVDASDGSEHLICQDSAEDFCYYCVTEVGVSKSKVRHFYKTIYEDVEIRSRKLGMLDVRLDHENPSESF